MNELSLLTKILPMLPMRDDLTVGAGDDAAVIKLGDTYLLAAVDQLVSDIHYYSKKTRPEEAGAKLIKRNLSDIAAMGGTPAWALITLAEKGMSEEWMIAFHRGICEVAGEYNVAVAGGDLCAAPCECAVATLTILGTVETEKLCLRRNAKPDDIIFITGKLGKSLPTGHHLTFTPRLKESAFLAGKFTCAMMDISDGLAQDAARFAAASNTSFALNLNSLPPRNHASIQQMLGDGEDYELIFCVPPEKVQELKNSWPFNTELTEVGRVFPPGNLKITDIYGNAVNEENYGYKHFE